MAGHLISRVFGIAVLSILLGITILVVEDKDLPGTAIQFNRPEPAEVQVTAYASQEKLEDTGDCPVYKDRIDADNSSPESGAFTLQIPREQRTFLATACGAGYYPRVISTVENREDDSLFVPHPLKMYPRTDRFEETLDPAIANTLAAFVSDMRYLRSIDAEAFELALTQLSKFRETPAEQQLIEALGEVVRLNP